MGTIKKFFRKRLGEPSLRRSFLLYVPICFILSFAGAFGIGVGTNYLQDLYSSYADKKLYYEVRNDEPQIEFFYDENGEMHMGYVKNRDYGAVYFIISSAQYILIPAWVLLCLWLTGRAFYARELKEPIDTLMDASQKISENQLDFEVYYYKQNELGKLCTAVNDMRRALFESNRELWRSLEERKRLNAAFSHDLRTPLTVLKGYAEYLRKYTAEGKISSEKSAEILLKMNGQIDRLERYAQKMSSMQSLDNIVPEPSDVPAERLRENLLEAGKFSAGTLDFSLDFYAEENTVFCDAELVMQVYENLVSNAAVYAKSAVKTVCRSEKSGALILTVKDDGCGFSEDALKRCTEPFFRGGSGGSEHFGLGLYICRVICGKCGGSVVPANENGGKITAEFIFQK